MTAAKMRVGYRPTPGLVWPTRHDPTAASAPSAQPLCGFEYDLLEEMATKLGIRLEWLPMETEQQLVQQVVAKDADEHGMATRSIDLGVGAFEGTAALERQLDILYPHLRSRSVLLVKKSVRYWLKAALGDLFNSWVSRALLIGGFVFCYLPALTTTFFELQVPGSSFADTSSNPFFTAAWYAVVTISTVGYGDLSPVTTVGRFLAAPMIAFAPLLYVGLVQQVWITFKNAFFRAEYLDRETLKAAKGLNVAVVKGSTAEEALRCEVGCTQMSRLHNYQDLLQAALRSKAFDVLVVDEPVAAFILQQMPMKWSLGQQIAEGLGYSCLVTEDFRFEEEMRSLIFSFHESSLLSALREKHFAALGE